LLLQHVYVTVSVNEGLMGTLRLYHNSCDKINKTAPAAFLWKAFENNLSLPCATVVGVLVLSSLLT